MGKYVKKGRNPKCLENLKPFKPGQSGNPGGRTKSKELSAAYRRKLEQLIENDPKGRTFAELIADALINEAIKGKVPAAAEIADRTEGKPAQSITLGGALEVDIESIDERIRTLSKRVRDRAADSSRKD
jgi:hypothetical protein